MVITIILALCIPITCLVMGFFMLQGIKLGLKINKPEANNLHINNQPHVPEGEEVKYQSVEDKPTDKQQAPPHEIINEWLYGATER